MRTAVLVKVVDGEIGPFDASALEWALSRGDEVTVLSMGPKSWTDVLLPLTRLGVSRVILLSDPVFAGSDTLATATVLAASTAAELAARNAATVLALPGKWTLTLKTSDKATNWLWKTSAS